MKKTFFVLAMLVASAVNAADYADGSQAGFGAKFAGYVLEPNGTWRVRDEFGMWHVIDSTTTVKFRGNSRIKAISDLKPGSKINVHWCVIHEGNCDTRADIAALYDFDPNEVPRIVEFVSQK